MSNHYLESRAALLAAISHLTPVSTAATLTDKADKYYRFIYLPSGDTPATLGLVGRMNTQDSRRLTCAARRHSDSKPTLT